MGQAKVPKHDYSDADRMEFGTLNLSLKMFTWQNYTNSRKAYWNDLHG